MTSDEQIDVARRVADLNTYATALNQCQSVEEVVSLTIEATEILFGFEHTTMVDVRSGALLVAHSTNPDHADGDEPSDPAYEAYRRKETVRTVGEAESSTASAHVVAVPAIVASEVAAVLVAESKRGPVEDGVVRTLEILASHAATAISNIRSHRELTRARRSLETRTELLELYDSLLRHDLGNKLNIIEGYAELLATSDDGGTDHAETILRSARSSIDLIGRVGEVVSTLEAQQDPRPTSLRPVLETTVGDVREAYDTLSVTVDPEAIDYTVRAGDLLTSVFTNLLSNAAVHNDGDVLVEIYCEATAGEVVVGIADDGQGVPADVGDAVFEMGAKGRDSDGTGMGLGFVAHLVEAYGGSIGVRESGAGGADFRVTLERA